MENQLIPFGKYKGQPLEILVQDPQYLEWIQQQGWFADEPPYIEEIKFKTECYDVSFLIEIKPSVGDDYPAILRQIRSLKSQSHFIKILLVNEYNGIGISEENFIKLFKTQGIIVLFIRDIV